MANGKIRAQAHIIDDKTIGFVKQQLPDEWVVRELSPDYGIDLDVEVFQYEDGQIVTLGEHLFLQVKGKKSAKYREFSIKTDEGIIKEKYLCFSLETDLLKLVERSGNATSVLLITVDLALQQAYFVCLNDYIDCVLCDEPKWRNQAYKTIYIPCSNLLSITELLRWYSIRGKLLSFFCEAKALESEMLYCTDVEKYISAIVNYADRIHHSDVWQTIELGFFYLRQSYSIVQDIVKYGFMPQITHFFSENELYTIGCFENMTAHQSRQVMSGKHLFESIDTANTAFFDYFKPLYVPSKHNTFQKYYKQDTE